MQTFEPLIVTPDQFTAVVKTLLSAELGAFKNGRPAIWVEPPWMPSRGTGLHCVIQRQPIMLSHRLIRTRQANQTYEFLATLTAEMESAPLAAMDRALDKLRTNFPRHREVIPLPRDGRLVQANFYAQFNRTINVTFPTIPQ